MQLERIAMVLRPRSTHEVFDLAFAMLREWRGAIAAAWALTVLPLCALAFLYFDSAIAAFAVLWLLRPLFELVPLFVVSRGVFGSAPTVQDSLAQVPRLLGRHALTSVLRLRWRPWRALIAPVTLLEGSVGATRARRERELRVQASGSAELASLYCLLLELALFAQIVLLLWFFTPGELAPDLSPLEEGNFADVELGWFAHAMKLAWLASYSLCGPLHALVGFAAYMERRVQLEGWDVELGFRRLAARLGRLAGRGASVALLLLCGLALPLLAQDVTAVPEADAAEIAREVLRSSDFDTTETRSRLDLDLDSSSELEPRVGLGIFAHVLQLLGWVLLIALLVGVLVLILRKAGWVDWRTRDLPSRSPTPTHVFGLDVRPESLPEDIAARARELWLAGDKSGAMGLLYRASLSRLIAGGALQFDPGDTERDCVERVRGSGDAALDAYFASLSGAWLLCAYSNAQPPDELALGLCDGWRQQFERGGR